jgi:hypothetical protein
MLVAAASSGGLLSWANGKFGDVQHTMQLGMLVLGIAMIIAAYVKSKSLVPTLGAILLAAIANVAAFAPGLLGQMFGKEVNSSVNVPSDASGGR